jgi:hypothetical protein
VPRIVRTPDACLTCRRHRLKCSWGLPTCVTCDKNGYECIQPISTVGYESYIRDGDAQQSATKPNTTKRRKNKNKKKRKHKNKNTVENKIEIKVEEPKPRIKPRTRFDDGIIGWDMEYAPIFQKRDPSIPIPEKTATHKCTRRPATLYASGSESGVESGVELGSASGYVAGSESASESESSSVLTSASASTTTSGSASSGSAFESEFVTRIRRHLYEFQTRELERTHRYVKRPGSTSSEDVDQDHDYAVYYDYSYDFDPETLQGEVKNPSKFKTHPCLLNLDLVQNSWQGPGEPPLKTRIDDYITYMRENHLELGNNRTHLPLTLMASCDYTASDTLFYYEKRPANCGATDIPDINPVNPKLVRLGYANPLALQFVIAQRSNHRQVSSAILPTREIAERFFMDAIAQFGSTIDSYLAGGEHEMPTLFVASIVVALVEVGLHLSLPTLSYKSIMLTYSHRELDSIRSHRHTTTQQRPKQS